MEILHLEDSANDAALAEALMRGEWPECRIHHVGTRADYETAIHRGDFDVILSDYAMPDFDGLAALEIALSLRPEKPFIFMSGCLGEEHAIEALQSGAFDYVLKDRPGRLVPAIRQALARAEEQRRRRQAEDSLRENRERFRLITENVADLIAVFAPDGRRVYHNPAYQELLGYAPDQP
ncbi:MAG: response regulator, partial [Burkholderiales bacterium]|nr:response regulator [Opitutaceae bacterium]